MRRPLILRRSYTPEVPDQLVAAGVPPLLARIYAARGIASTDQLATDFVQLLPPQGLKGIDAAATLLADAIASGKRLLIVADYDADGATACAVGLRALRGFGAKVDYLVPNRFEFGYGLTPEIVRLATQLQPDILITVDNGIASIDGVAEANRLGMRVLVTDHHLPGDLLPDAAAIVNPNQPGCDFSSKHLAGVGVIFYVMLALRAELRARNWFASRPETNLAHLLDIVALGTVADVVRLDQNNRLLVHHGIARIRTGRACAGIRALLTTAGRDHQRVSTYDLGYVIGPRLNAAGRLTDMSLGIECLTTDDDAHALELAAKLDGLNRERRRIESEMRDAAEAHVDGIEVDEAYTLSLFDPSWHQGVVGLLASRLKERFHRPVIAFARGGDGTLKGSGRSIPPLHLRDALDLVAKRHPGMLLRFGGHAAAAGLTLAEADLARFTTAFEDVCRHALSPTDLDQVIETDGELSARELHLEQARLIEQAVWGQGFPAPRFVGEFRIEGQRIIGEKHLKLSVNKDGQVFEAIAFNQDSPMTNPVRLVYSPGINEYQGVTRLQLVVEHWEPV